MPQIYHLELLESFYVQINTVKSRQILKLIRELWMRIKIQKHVLPKYYNKAVPSASIVR